MGNSMSGQWNRGDPAHARLGYDEAAPEPYDPNVPRLRGGEAPRFSNGSASDPWFVDTSAAPEQAGNGRLSPQPAGDDFYEVPATDFYSARGSHTTRGGTSTVAGGHVSDGGRFDFNDNKQPNPWHGARPQQKRAPESVQDFEPRVEPERKIEVGFISFYHHRTH
jgi:hypothetical protein